MTKSSLTRIERSGLLVLCLNMADHPKSEGINLWGGQEWKPTLTEKTARTLEKKGLAVVVEYANRLVAKPTLRGVAQYLEWTRIT